jgi:hypothetical protein
MSRSPRPCLDALCPAQRRVLESFYAGQLPAGQLCEALQRARLERDAPPAMALAAPAAPEPAAVRVPHAA